MSIRIGNKKENVRPHFSFIKPPFLFRTQALISIVGRIEDEGTTLPLWEQDKSQPNGLNLLEK
jgi:hypothetical protein